MSYIDETYGKQLEEALRGLVSRPALGQPWFGFHASEVPAGVLLFTAATHSRVLYADFWKYIQDKNLVKTEEEWQSIYSEQGWCPFYSDGDGIDTFRMPSAPLYLYGANTLGEAGKYIKEGLPNITGAWGRHGTVTAIGAIAAGQNSSVRENIGVGGGYSNDAFDFNASLSNSIYGASDHVTPETSKMLFGVWAISAPQQPIPDATVEGIMSELGVASNNASEAKNGLNSVVRSVNDVVPDAMGNVDVVIPKAYITETWSSSYSWYRKYSDGWIEQGGISDVTNHATVTLPVAMTDTYYTITIGPNGHDGAAVSRGITNKTTTTFGVKVGYNDSLARNSYWVVAGYYQ